MSGRPTGWRLGEAAAATPSAPLVLDPAQQAVVDRVAAAGHGPLLVLAGPGTGKTATVVEAVAARVEAGTDPARILTLTFSRKAAQELRTRIGTRLGRTVATPLAWTFHGYGFSLLGRSQVGDDVGRPLALLSGPEQDVMLREMVVEGIDLHPDRWPEALRQALPTRGFADELRTLLARARSLGLEPVDLSAAGAPQRPDWVAAAHLLDEYLEVLDARGAVDYAELVARAVAFAESAAGRRELRAAYDLVVVDEYQDTDPAQERLLQALAGDGRDLVVVGDPDQSIYAFRGAEVRGILQFRDRFRRSDGSAADVAVLQTCRRSGPSLLAASRSVAQRLPTAGAELGAHLREHRALTAAAGLPPGAVEVLTYPTEGQQAAAVADLLRREHLQHRRPWQDMAVLVRSGVLEIPPLQRVLAAHGVPVEVAGDELPLAQAPAVSPLVLALRVVADPAALTADVAATLLASPLAAVDAARLRELGRALRAEERAAGTPAGQVPPSADLLRDALADGRLLVAADDHLAAPVRALGELVRRAREAHRRGGSVYEVLWVLWEGSDWRDRLLAASDVGGPAGRSADRDLDAVVALFDVAARTEVRSEGRGLQAFLAELTAQQIPGDSLAERSAKAGGVRLLTAHRSKGLEWPLVVVTGVQEERWPDVDHRGSLLSADRLTPEGLGPPPTARTLLDEERRLFYVAVTRAKERLVVTAVASAEDDGQRPSRFLDELGVPVEAVTGRPPRPLTLPGLAAHLRATVVDPGLPTEVREAAATRLARLASAEVGGHRLVPSADPDRWWGILPPTEAVEPVRPRDEPLALSGSSLDGLVSCPLRWFLEHEVRAVSSRGTALGFGSVVHAIADGVATEQVEADLAVLMGRIDTVWRQLQFAAAWESDQQREEARAAVARFLAWHQADRGRTVVGSEQEFRVELAVGGRTVLLRGRLDRVELDVDGRVVVVDFKTGRSAPSQADVDGHLQLAVYQRAVREGAVTDAGSEPGGAELVQLRIPRGDGPKVQHQAPPSTEADLLDVALADAVQTIEAEDFHPVPSQACLRCDYRRVCPAQDEGRGVVP